MSRNRKLRKIVKSTNIVLYISISVLLITLLVFLAIQFELFERNEHETVEPFNIQDTCAFIAGQLVHNIDDEGGCQNQCITACEVRNSEYLDSRFTRSFEACNNCYCECK